MQQVIEALTQLGEKLSGFKSDNNILSAINRAERENAWFSGEMIRYTFKHWGELLTAEILHAFVDKYPIANVRPQRVGIVMAGNIPLVGMHDLLMVLLSGHHAYVKLSSKDRVLPELIEKLLREINPGLADNIHFKEQLFKNTDAVIATGSNNSARYFASYFEKIPHIIRKNRNSVAVLNGNESTSQLENLADDVFLYFGLGCRNVSKVYVPQDYDVTKILDAFEKYSHFLNHPKYMNNYVYQKAILLMDMQKHLDNDFLLLQEHESMASPVSVLHFERYDEVKVLKEKLNFEKDKIQCICSDMQEFKNAVSLGDSQKPGLDTFADNIDSMDFLLNL